jgi:transposase
MTFMTSVRECIKLRFGCAKNTLDACLVFGYASSVVVRRRRDNIVVEAVDRCRNTQYRRNTQSKRQTRPPDAAHIHEPYTSTHFIRGHPN